MNTFSMTHPFVTLTMLFSISSADVSAHDYRKTQTTREYCQEISCYRFDSNSHPLKSLAEKRGVQLQRMMEESHQARENVAVSDHRKDLARIALP